MKSPYLVDKNPQFYSHPFIDDSGIDVKIKMFYLLQQIIVISTRMQYSMNFNEIFCDNIKN